MRLRWLDIDQALAIVSVLYASRGCLSVHVCFNFNFYGVHYHDNKLLTLKNTQCFYGQR